MKRLSKNMKAVLIAGAGILVALGILFWAAGCVSPPAGTVEVNTNQIPGPDALAVDADGDGEADEDANGNVILVESMTPYYAAAESLDERGPELMSWTGALAGIPVLTTLGALWKRHKWAKGFANLVASVQAGREALKDRNYTGALKVVDTALTVEELDKTVAMIKDVKATLAKKEG